MEEIVLMIFENKLSFWCESTRRRII